jgi:hypothetical protein
LQLQTAQKAHTTEHNELTDQLPRSCMTGESDNEHTVNADRYVTAEQRQRQTNGHSNYEGYRDISEKQCNGRTAFLKHNDWIMMKQHQLAAATETNSTNQ